MRILAKVEQGGCTVARVSLRPPRATTMQVHLNPPSCFCCPVRGTAGLQHQYEQGWVMAEGVPYHYGFADVVPSVKCDGNADVAQRHTLKVTDIWEMLCSSPKQ